jgi:penicillin V acylase-like amidase (Ntn superfamily)
MKNLRYYIRTYDNFDIRMIDLGKADRNAKQIKFISLDKPQTVKDLTP